MTWSNAGNEDDDGKESAMLTKNPTAAIMSAMPKGCEASAAQMSGFKTDSEQKLKLDSKQSKCGRKKCRDLGLCFAHRKKSHESD